MRDDETERQDSERPRLTPQGRIAPDPEGTDATDLEGGGAKGGQPDKSVG